jgi:transcriptional regulator with XRE-family HTH domain
MPAPSSVTQEPQPWQQFLGGGQHSVLRNADPKMGCASVVSYLPAWALGRMNETFAERVRRVREERGFTVPDLAAAVGVSPGAIRQLESGQIKNPSFALGLRLANRLNVDPQYLALGEGFSLTERLESIEQRVAVLERQVEAIPRAQA